MRAYRDDSSSFVPSRHSTVVSEGSRVGKESRARWSGDWSSDVCSSDLDQIAEYDVARQGREPVLGGGVLTLWPYDQQPFLGRLAGTPMARRHVNAHAGKP